MIRIIVADPSPRKRLRHGSERANHTSTEHATADHTTTEQASTEGAGAEDGVEYAAVGENVSVDLRTVRAWLFTFFSLFSSSTIDCLETEESKKLSPLVTSGFVKSDHR